MDVSIIVPAWNARAFLSGALSSALAQAGVTCEIIVADDASTDSTADLAEAFGASVRCLRLPRNGGPAAARNAALEAARGEWIAVLDADDAFLPGRLARLVAEAAGAGLDIIADNMWIEDATGKRRLFIDEPLDGGLEPIGFAFYARDNRLFRRGSNSGYLKPVFRRVFLQKHALRYDASLRIGEDFLLVAEALALGARFARLRDAYYIYVTRDGSISSRLSAVAAAAMVRGDERLLAAHRQRLTVYELQALRAHDRSLRDGAAYLDMVEALKRADLRATMRAGFGRPQAMRHLTMPVTARLRRAVRVLAAA